MSARIGDRAAAEHAAWVEYAARAAVARYGACLFQADAVMDVSEECGVPKSVARAAVEAETARVTR